MCLLLGTNLIHDFVAMTRSVKLGFIYEKRGFQTLSYISMQILLFAACHTLNRWYYFLSNANEWLCMSLTSLLMKWNWWKRAKKCCILELESILLLNRTHEISVNFSNSLLRECSLNLGMFSKTHREILRLFLRIRLVPIYDICFLTPVWWCTFVLQYRWQTVPYTPFLSLGEWHWPVL